MLGFSPAKVQCHISHQHEYISVQVFLLAWSPSVRYFTSMCKSPCMVVTVMSMPPGPISHQHEQLSVWFVTCIYLSVKFHTSMNESRKAPLHSDKDHGDHTTLLERRSSRWERGQYEHKCSFQVHSTSLLRPDQVLTTSNTFSQCSCYALDSYYDLYVCAKSSALLLRSSYDNYDRTTRLCHVLTTHFLIL